MIIILVLVLFIVYCIVKCQTFNSTAYSQSTHLDYFSVRFDKGLYGEYSTYAELAPLQMDGAKFIFNCYLPTSNGETTEIDLIMIHYSGIYVVESKNYSGWIFGSTYREMWTQTLPNGRKARKERFLNPVIQNQGHIRWLKKVIGETYPIISLIVFSDRCTFKDVDVCCEDTYVIKRQKVWPTILKLKNDRKELSEEQINHLYNILFGYSQVSPVVKADHVRDIRERSYKSNYTTHADSAMKCPRCEGKLVKRTASKGRYAGNSFYGCSNYPKCTYIQNIGPEMK